MELRIITHFDSESLRLDIYRKEIYVEFATIMLASICYKHINVRFLLFFYFMLYMEQASFVRSLLVSNLGSARRT